MQMARNELEILTYNVEFGKRLTEIYNWLHTIPDHPDFICFQEFPENAIGTLRDNLRFKKLVYKFAPSFVRKGEFYGELTVFDGNLTSKIETEILDLGESRIERIYRRSPSRRSALITTLDFKGKKLTIVNIHLVVLALNRKRRQQLTLIFESLKNDSSAIIIGDFNYTSLLGRKGLVNFMNKFKFELAGGKMITNHLKKIPQQLDYVFHKGCALEGVRVEKIPFSDHYPVFATVDLGVTL